MSEQETQQPAKKPLYKRWWVWLLGVIVLFIIIGAANSNPSTNNTANNTSTTKPAEQVKQEVKTLLKISGNGTKSTEKFTTTGDWTMDWSYNCANFGQKGNFSVIPYGENNAPSFANGLVNQLGDKDQGTENYYKAGTYYLQVNSVCSWNIEVKG